MNKIIAELPKYGLVLNILFFRYGEYINVRFYK
jgi:hypothetical protein